MLHPVNLIHADQMGFYQNILLLKCWPRAKCYHSVNLRKDMLRLYNLTDEYKNNVSYEWESVGQG